MNRSPKKLLACMSLAVSLCLLWSLKAAGAETVSARTLPNSATRQASIVSNDIPVIEIPASIFVADYADRSARDPFFPDATYIKRTTVTEKTEAPKQTLDGSVLKSLKLTGMGGVGDKRWAMLNNVTLYLGEDTKIQIGGKPLQIECVEMDEKSVTIGIKGTAIRRRISVE